MRHSSFLLEPVAPFRLDLTAWTLRRRAHNLIDRFEDGAYRRTLSLPAGPVEVAVTQTQPSHRPLLRVEVTGAPVTASVRRAVTAALERLLGLSIDLAPFYKMAEHDEKLHGLVDRFRGMKPPRFASVFEGIINGVACQQLSLTVGIYLLNRMAEQFGPTAPGGAGHAFPRPEDLQHLSAEILRPLGISRQKSRAIIELSTHCSAEPAALDELYTLPDDEARARLLKLRGVGRWTAEYVMLRTLGKIDIFPGDDVGARNSLEKWLNVKTPLDYGGIDRALARWRPYNGLIYFHLLLGGLVAAGVMSTVES